MKKNRIKDTGVEVTELSFGTSSLGSMPDTYGYEVPEQRAGLAKLLPWHPQV